MLPPFSHLPRPVLDSYEWQARGLCRGMDSARFFHPDNERGHQRRDRQAGARAICARCPVLSQCRAHALITHEPYGMWGGLSEEERRHILAEGRPAIERSLAAAG